MTFSWYRFGFGLVATLALAPSLGLHSEASASPGQGGGDDALPGVFRTDSAEAIPEGIVLSASGSYGYTDSTLSTSDTHHRGLGRMVAAYRISSDLALGLRIDGRYDKHFLRPGRDDGWVGDPRFFVRYRITLTPSLNAGMQLGVWAPGRNAPSIATDAISADAVAALTWASENSPLTLSANVGYRLDRSAASISEPDRLSLADRMSLGLSDYNAVLAAVGVSYDVGVATVLAEWSLDLLHGSGAPSFGSSPMRVAVGGSYPVAENWSLFGSSEFRLSEFPASEIDDMLLPFDPRVSILAGVQMRFGVKPATAALVPDVVAKPDPEPTPEVITATLNGRVTSDAKPVPGATLVLLDAKGDEHTVSTDVDGAYAMPAIPLGRATLAVSADGFENSEQSIVVAKGGTTEVVQIERSLPPGQLRGQVRSFRGEGLQARLTVSPGEHSIETDGKGGFELDLPPGDYQVTISVPGFKPQERQIHIDENGVTILNVDLRRGDQKR